MNRKPNPPARAGALRRQAERQLNSGKPGPRPRADLERLLHELQVHQVELELQNAELQGTRDELTEALARYTELYDFAPAGYLTTRPDGTILLANLTAATLLGIERPRLLGCRLASFVDPASRPALEAVLTRASEARTTQTAELSIPTAGRQPLTVQIEVRGPNGGQEYRVLLTDITERKEAEESLRRLTSGLLHAQDEERRRVARELHDTTAQSLTALLLKLNLLRHAVPGLDGRAKHLLADSLTLASQCTQEIRTSSYLLHPPILDDLGLAEAIRDHADGFARRTGLRVDLELSPELNRLPRATELALFRILQEALTNILRHSGSRTASISLAQSSDQCRLEIRDQGRGMSSLASTAPGGPPPGGAGMGIVGMRERIRQLGGQLVIHSGPRGTSIVATLPTRPGSPRP